jgi:hypothetical protein
MARITLAAVWMMGMSLVHVVRADAPAASSSPPARKIQPSTQVHQAVDRAVVYLQSESSLWMKQRRCASCHHAGMALWSLNEAARFGFAVDKDFVAQTTESIVGSHEKMMASKLIANPADPPDTRPLARAVPMGTVFMAVAARSSPALPEGQKQSLKQIADVIVQKQQADGSWEFFLSRPPVNESQTTDVAWMLLALHAEASADGSKPYMAAFEKGRRWLADPKVPKNSQDKVLELLLDVCEGRPPIQWKGAVGSLLAAQRPDGGWGQTPTLPSDAFATGQTLYALLLAGEPANRQEMQRSIEFLVKTQKPDGSWPMASRSSPDGKPGAAKLLTPINTAAASWAVLALSRSVPKAPTANARSAASVSK